MGDARLEGMAIRAATSGDVDVITEIYNEAVEQSTATFDTETQSVAQRLKWFQEHGPNHPVAVADCRGAVAGWGALSPWSPRAAYRETVELSFYVRVSQQGQGVGTALLRWLVEEARRLEHFTVIARVAEGSEASLHVCQSGGFQPVGVLRSVGLKFDRRLDVSILQLMLNSS